MSNMLDGKVCIVTGGGRGLGRGADADPGAAAAVVVVPANLMYQGRPLAPPLEPRAGGMSWAERWPGSGSWRAASVSAVRKGSSAWSAPSRPMA